MQGQRRRRGSVVAGFLLRIRLVASVAAARRHLALPNRRAAPGRYVQADRGPPDPAASTPGNRSLQHGQDRFRRMGKPLPAHVPGRASASCWSLTARSTAGVDLGRIAAADIIVSGQTIRMKIPDPEIFSAASTTNELVSTHERPGCSREWTPTWSRTSGERRSGRSVKRHSTTESCGSLRPMPAPR